MRNNNPKRLPDATIELLCPMQSHQNDKSQTQMPSFSYPRYDLHARSTVNAEDLAVDPLAVLRGKEADNTGNINGETNTVERRPGSSEL